MLKRIIVSASGLALWLVGCASGPPVEESSVQALAGTWTFSHIGALRGLPDVKAASASKLQDSRIIVAPDGRATLDVMGEERETTVAFDEDSETQIVFSLGEGEDFLVYDKASGLLWKRTEIDLGGISGKMPAYFHRQLIPASPPEAPEPIEEAPPDTADPLSN